MSQESDRDWETIEAYDEEGLSSGDIGAGTRMHQDQHQHQQHQHRQRQSRVWQRLHTDGDADVDTHADTSAANAVSMRSTSTLASMAAASAGMEDTRTRTRSGNRRMPDPDRRLISAQSSTPIGRAAATTPLLHSASPDSLSSASSSSALQALSSRMTQRPQLALPPPTPDHDDSLVDEDEKQVVLQNEDAVVLYDPRAHELAVYDHMPITIPRGLTAPPLSAPSIPSTVSALSRDTQATTTLSLLPASEAHSMTVQAFRAPTSMEQTMGVCRLCHRPFWPWSTAAVTSASIPLDLDEQDFPPTDMRPPHRFTAQDYFDLLASAGQTSAEATGSSRDDSGPSREGSGRVSEEDEEHEHSSVRRRVTRRSARSRTRSRRRPQSSVVVEEEMDENDASPASITVRRSSLPQIEHDVPIVVSRRSRSSGHRRGRRRRDAQDDMSQSGSGSWSPEQANQEHDHDDVLECGLHRSSFNNGYYARFFREECKIGSGGVGGVYLTHHVLDEVMLGTYAVKKIPVGNSRPWLLQVLKEVRALEGLHHRHIVAYKHSWLETFKPSDFGPEVPCLFMLMEYANKGTLHDLIWPRQRTGKAATSSSASVNVEGRSGVGGAAAARSRMTGPPAPQYMSEDQIWWVFIGMCLGLRHLHRSGVIHRDLKPENLLLSSEIDALGREHGMRVLVSDFGNVILKGVPYNRTGNTGTLAYSAPETLLSQENIRTGRGATQMNSSPSAAASPFMSFGAATSSIGGVSAAASSSPSTPDSSMPIPYTEACDLWSCGVILYAMAFSKLPFHSNSPESLLREIQSQADRLDLPSTPARSPEMKACIRQLLAFDPAARPSLDHLLNLPFIIQRRQKRYADFAAFQQHATRMTTARVSGALMERRENYRPPPPIPASHDVNGGENALVVSPTLLSTPTPLRTRSTSPAPLTLPSRALPTDSHSVRHISDGPNAPSSLPSHTLVPSSFPSTPVTSEALPWFLTVTLSGLTHVFKLVSWMLSRVTGRPLPSIPLCWRCMWGTLAEGSLHLLAIFVKVWLSINVLLNDPTRTSMYLHVFPQLLGTFTLFLSTALPLVRPPSSPHSPSRPDKRSPRTRTRTLTQRLLAYADAASIRWQGGRILLALWMTLLSTFWLLMNGEHIGWHLLNAFVMIIQLVAILCAFYAAHPSHAATHLPPVRSDPRILSPSPVRTPMQPTESTSLHPSVTPLARLPLLLPPAPSPQAVAVADARNPSATPTQQGGSTDGRESRIIQQQRRLR